MQFIYLVLFSFTLLPSRGEKDTQFRIALAHSIINVTSDETEQLTLILIARYESGFRRNVARCETHKEGMHTEDHGKSFGTYQVQPITSSDRDMACGSLDEQSQLALNYIRRSAEVCSKNVGADALNIYTSGRCYLGHDESVKRWGGTVMKEFMIVKGEESN